MKMNKLAYIPFAIALAQEKACGVVHKVTGAKTMDLMSQHQAVNKQVWKHIVDGGDLHTAREAHGAEVDEAAEALFTHLEGVSQRIYNNIKTNIGDAPTPAQAATEVMETMGWDKGYMEDLVKKNQDEMEGY